MKIMFAVNSLGLNEPFGPMMLSAVLKKQGHTTRLCVLQKRDAQEKILKWKPDILAYSMMSVDIKDTKRFNDALQKKARVFTLLGGAHATLNRDCINDIGVDAVCVGEGEGAILDAVGRLNEGKDLEGIPNIAVSADAPLELRGLIEDFDAYPFMDRELVYSYPEMRRFGVKGVWTSRGCAFPCPYCFNNRYNGLFRGIGRPVRRRSVSSVIQETLELKRQYRADFIRIQDDVFVYTADEWLREFAKRWSAEVRLPFYCLLRAELVTEEMAFYLKKAGCFSVCMSIECADDSVRNRMLRRKISRPQLEKVFGIFRKHKINVYSNTMLGFPFTSLEHDIRSLDFAVKMRPQMPNFSIFMPYPGTDLGDYCHQAGIYDHVNDDITYGMRNMSPLSCFSEKEKRAQYNLCELAIVAVKLPFLRGLIVKRLVYWRPNKIFFLIHYMFAVASYDRWIFRFRHTAMEYVDLFRRTFRHYLYDYTGKKKEAAFSRAPQPLGERSAQLKRCMDTMSGCAV